MPASERATPLFAVLLVALLTAATIGLSAFVVISSPTGAVAAATATPGQRARPSAAPAATSPAPPTDLPSGEPPSIQPSSGPGESAGPPPSATPEPPAEPVLAMNLYRKGDFISQQTTKQCLSAAMQIMLNVIGPVDDRSKHTQASLAKLAKSLSKAPYGGTEPLGWARGLQKRGAGHYEVVVETTLNRAIRRGVKAIRETGRPVGLLVWRGAHSWVLHGFQTTADPVGTDSWTVKNVFVSDPWYPRTSNIWGKSRGPNARVTPKQLTEDYLPWRRPTGRYPGMDGKYVLVIPVDD